MNEYVEWLIIWFKKKNPKIILELEENYINSGVIDSLGIIELVEDIEEAFNINFNQSNLQDRRFSSINGLAKIILEIK
jgi:acyl carrier protein|tara:strand:- start:208 stop:441 length:234 start_codon:yes stop_codon:yes gene_type:complete